MTMMMKFSHCKQTRTGIKKRCEKKHLREESIRNGTHRRNFKKKHYWNGMDRNSGKTMWKVNIISSNSVTLYIRMISAQDILSGNVL